MIDAGILASGERAELIGGEILTMTPQKSPHAAAVSLAQIAVQVAFGPGCHARVQLPLALDPDSEPEPDVVVVAGGPRDYRHAHPRTALLVVEVADTTLGFDRERKGSLYARAGIAEYWIVNLVEAVVEVYRDPTVATEAPFGWAYRSAMRLGMAETIVPLGASTSRVAVPDLLP
jgi:Uma2 family endonuclease